ncbi:MAG: Hsp20/alpha crystallin family protein [Acidobacteria bacterium]|nr:Hsp20/alpha crystallin family protein [Acidobacteriota bacterium]
MAQHWDPIRDLVTLQERMNRLFEDATERRARNNSSSNDEEHDLERADWTPPADVYNREHEYVIMVDLPGIDRETLDISVDENRLWIRGTRSVEQDAQQQPNERPHGSFLRKFGPLPPTIDQQAIKAEYKDGVLRLTLPKREEQKTRRVEIKVS